MHQTEETALETLANLMVPDREVANFMAFHVRSVDVVGQVMLFQVVKTTDPLFNSHMVSRSGDRIWRCDCADGPCNHVRRAYLYYKNRCWTAHLPAPTEPTVLETKTQRRIKPGD